MSCWPGDTGQPDAGPQSPTQLQPEDMGSLSLVQHGAVLILRDVWSECLLGDCHHLLEPGTGGQATAWDASTGPLWDDEGSWAGSEAARPGCVTWAVTKAPWPHCHLGRLTHLQGHPKPRPESVTQWHTRMGSPTTPEDPCKKLRTQ